MGGVFGLWHIRTVHVGALFSATTGYGSRVALPTESTGIAFYAERGLRSGRLPLPVLNFRDDYSDSVILWCRWRDIYCLFVPVVNIFT